MCVTGRDNGELMISETTLWKVKTWLGMADRERPTAGCIRVDFHGLGFFLEYYSPWDRIELGLCPEPYGTGWDADKTTRP